jgi:3-dehydroquinate dehydratase-1
MPQKPEDVITLMQATIEARRQFEQPMFTMAMGELGSPTRISGALFGSCATFAAGLAASAPGQIPVSMVSAILKQLRPSR